MKKVINNTVTPFHNVNVLEKGFDNKFWLIFLHFYTKVINLLLWKCKTCLNIEKVQIEGEIVNK